jgi:hypothetical protein
MPSAKLAAYAAPSAERGLSQEVLAREYGINRSACGARLDSINRVLSP